jgi:adenosylmethionine-8-amino-7-oxononanoate aminotransferase
MVFMHGPTFMANPLACAVANASIELLHESPWQTRVQSIEAHFSSALDPLRMLEAVKDVRVLGAIGVVEMKEPLNVSFVQEALIDEGVWLRPFGKLLYAMPPYVMEEEQLRKVTDAMSSVVNTL